MAKNILVTGATGKQGGAVIDSLANNSAFTLLAVTRNASSPSAEKLKSKGSNVKVVQGDMDDVPTLFKNALAVAGGEPIYGVYSVQISEGKGVTGANEIKQGKAMIDEAVKSNVQHFVYSSVERGGDEASWNNKTPIPHFQTKWEIEHHLKDNAGSMQWTILRPVAFMDNLAPGFPAKVFTAALRDTLGPKPMQWVATADIGEFVRLAFEKPDEYKNKALGLAGDELTMAQFATAFKNKTGTPLEGTFWFLGSFLKYMVVELRLMIDWFGSDGYKADIPGLKKKHPGLLDLETWIETKSAFKA
ncbi:NAD(P)-binding protein [Polychaeton citri CBS 116435]|uniref:NAD(P)-binding protein n=1 Tax=Polychaeton citri CBS 116435 TaxID=1314669 RepID=A0A9P4QCN8_9PEZI|nr:NAD(P)-binding protein [Polychaeton citri CBS 116435]